MRWRLWQGTADYTFGHSLEEDTSEVVRANGGEVLGAVRHPLGTTDFSAFLLTAEASGADILGLANAGPDLVNAIKGAKEFGLADSMKLASLLMFINDIHALGLENTKGLLMTESWNWTLSPEARAFGERFFEKMGKMPNGPGTRHPAVPGPLFCYPQWAAKGCRCGKRRTALHFDRTSGQSSRGTAGQPGGRCA